MTALWAGYDARQRLVLGCALPLLFVCGLSVAAAPLQAALIYGTAGAALAATVFCRQAIYPILFLAPFESNFLGLALYYPWSVKEIDLFPLYPLVMVFPLAGLALSRLASDGRPPFPDALRPLVLSFAAWTTLSMAWAPLFEHSLLHWAVLVCNILLYCYVIGIVDNEAFLRTIMRCLIAYGLLVALANILVRYSPQVAYKLPLLEHVNFEFYVRGMETNFRSRSIANDNMTAYTLNLFMCVAGAHLLAARTLLARLWLAACLMFMYWGMLLCQSKAGTMSCFALLAYFVLVFDKSRRNVFLWTPVAVGLFVFLFYANTLYLDDPKTPRLLYQIGTESLSWRWRLDLWGRYWEKLLSGRLLEGMGAGGLIFDSHVPHAHSIYFSVLFDFGLVGFAMLLAGLCVLAGRFWAMRRFQDTYSQILFVALCGGLLTMAVQGVFDSSYLMPVITLFLGLTSAAYALAKRDAAPKQG